MSQTTPTTKSSAAAHVLETAYCHLGVDRQGAAHCWHAPTNTIHVIYNGRRRQRIPIDGVREFRSVDHYVHRIEAERGWQTRAFGFEAFLDRLGEVV